MGSIANNFFIFLGYMSSACKAKYFSKLCKYEKCQLKNVLMFEDYVLGKRYCDMFSPYTEEQMYDSNSNFAHGKHPVCLDKSA